MSRIDISWDDQHMKFVIDYLPLEMLSMVQDISFTYHELMQKHSFTMPDEIL